MPRAYIKRSAHGPYIAPDGRRYSVLLEAPGATVRSTSPSRIVESEEDLAQQEGWKDYEEFERMQERDPTLDERAWARMHGVTYYEDAAG